MNKYILNKENLNNCLNMAKISGLPFELTISNYTAKIECLENDFLNFQFVKSEKSILFFANYRLLKKEVETFLLNNKIELKPELKYFHVLEKKDFHRKNILNIDLSSAYLHVLKNEKIITDELFDKLNKLDKLDRLGVVGMLASKKNKYYYNSGELQDLEIINNIDLSNVFFYCVQKTHDIMTDLKNIIGNDYIFTWVDGIYFDINIKNINLFEEDNNIKKIKEYLDLKKYPYKVELLNNFIYNKYNNNANISYLKNGEEKNFSIPLQKGTFLNDMYEYLNNENNLNK